MNPSPTVQQALAGARARLARVPGVEPLDAAVLLAHVLGVERTALIAHPERTLTPTQAARFHSLIEQRAAGVPVAYLTGTRTFYDRIFTVTPAVLIPRPETEHLVEAALSWAAGRDGLRVVDVGTGSGAIAVTLTAHLPGARVWAVDTSSAALAVARHNAACYDQGNRITFVIGDLLAPLAAVGQTVDLIAANLPYIPSGDLDTLAVARHEPRPALDGGPDGLTLIRRLLVQAPDVLAPGGLLLLEVGADQGARVCDLAGSAFPGAQIRVVQDYAEYDRVVCVET